MSKAGSKGMAGMAMAVPKFVKSYYSTGPCSHASNSDLVEPCSVVSSGEHVIL